MEEKQIEIAQEVGVATLKAAIGNIPIVGSLLSDLLFDMRGRIKQNRINVFVESLAEYMGKSEFLDIKHDKIKNEEFSDILENVIHMVSRTRSKKKIDLFRQVIVDQMVSDTPPETTELYLEIIDRITEKQVLILDGLHDSFGSSYPELNRRRAALQREIDTLEAEKEREGFYFPTEEDERGTKFKVIKEKLNSRKKLDEEIKAHSRAYSHETYNCEGPEFYYFLQDLSNKGLLVDIGTRFGAEPFEVVEITQMGMDIVGFIKKDEQGTP